MQRMTLSSRDCIKAYCYSGKDVLPALKRSFDLVIIALDLVMDLSYKQLCQSFGFAAIITDLIHILLSDRAIYTSHSALLKIFCSTVVNF